MLPFIALIQFPCHSLHLQASIGNYGLLYVFTFLWSWYGHICWSHNIFDSSSHTTTHMVIHSYPTPYIHSPHWLLEYHLKLGPVSLGQYITLHLRAADCFVTDPPLNSLVEGHLDKIVGHSPNWVTFWIVDLEGREVALLGVPYAP